MRLSAIKLVPKLTELNAHENDGFLNNKTFYLFQEDRIILRLLAVLFPSPHNILDVLMVALQIPEERINIFLFIWQIQSPLILERHVCHIVI